MLTCSIKANKVELIGGSVIEELVPRAQTRDFIVWKHPCVTIGAKCGVSLFFCDLLRHPRRVPDLFNAVDPTGFWDFHKE